jgi:hypothetical protein
MTNEAQKDSEKNHQSSNRLQFMLTPFSGAKIAGGRTMLGITHRNNKNHQGTGSINGRCSSFLVFGACAIDAKLITPSPHTHTHTHTHILPMLAFPFYQAN